jgi:hypothetical protein
MSGFPSMLGRGTRFAGHAPLAESLSMPTRRTAASRFPCLFVLPAWTVTPRRTRPETIMMLIDEFTVSTADLVAGMFQDAGHGVLYGMRTNGAGDRGEHQSFVRCVAAPIRNATGRVFGAISVTWPSERITEGRVPVLSIQVIQAADSTFSRRRNCAGDMPASLRTARLGIVKKLGA